LVALKARIPNNTVYIRRLKIMNIPLEFNTVQKTTDELALLNSRAIENFLDKDVWKRLKIRRIRLPNALTVYNVNRTENHTGKIEFYCWLKIYYQRCMAQMQFYLTSLGGDSFILGYPFLYIFNPAIDWWRAQL
jgi:hypothetical protein